MRDNKKNGKEKTGRPESGGKRTISGEIKAAVAKSFREAGFHRRQEKLTRQQILMIVCMSVLVCVVFCICWWFVNPMIRLAKEPGSFRIYMQSKGSKGVRSFPEDLSKLPPDIPSVF